jgi:DNA-binding response OmpR family regulator
VLEDLRGDVRTRETPVILLTAKSQRDDRLAGWRAGCAHYVTTPFSPVDLVDVMDRAVSMTPGARDGRLEAALARLERHA